MNGNNLRYDVSNVLTFLFDSKGATFQQILRFAWKGKRTSLRDKIDVLIKTNQVSEFQGLCNGRVRQLYCLTPLGFKSVSGGLPLKHFKGVQLKTEVSNHDNILTDVREILKSMPGVLDVLSENEIQMGSYQIRPSLWAAQECNSDGLFFIKNPKNGELLGIHLEVEINQKQRFRLSKKLKMYADNSMSKELAILWVVPENIQKILKSESQAVITRLNSKNLRFYFADLESLLSGEFLVNGLIENDPLLFLFSDNERIKRGNSADK